MAPRRQPAAKADAPAPAQPFEVAAPAQSADGTHSFLLQHIIGITRDIAALSTKIEALADETREQRKEISSLKAEWAKIKGWTAGAAVVAVLAAGLVWWLVGPRVEAVLISPPPQTTAPVNR